MLPKSIIREFEQFFPPDAPCRALAQQYLEAVLNSDHQRASSVILDGVKVGIPINDIYVHVFQPILYLVGRLWQLQIISVAQEHLITAMTQAAMAQLYPHIMSGNKNGKKLVAACVGSELHEVGLRMLADLFEMEGWDTLFLGANTPATSVAETIAAEDPDVLAISTTMVFHIKNTEKLIKTVKDQTDDQALIVVGGIAFNNRQDLWKRIGGDGFAPDAQQALAVVRELVSQE